MFNFEKLEVRLNAIQFAESTLSDLRLYLIDR